MNLILVGNKADLPASDHEVTVEMGKTKAAQWGVPFMETSAKTGQNVFDAFQCLVREIKKNRDRRAAGSDCELNEYPAKRGCACTIL